MERKTFENKGSDAQERVLSGCVSECRRWESNPHGGSPPEDFKSTGLPDLSPSQTRGSRLISEPLAPPLPHFAPDLPSDLAVVVAAWPTLPEALKSGIMAMVKAATGR